MGSQAPLGKGDLFNTPGAELPGFVREVARALMRNGKPKSQAIQIAIGQIKRWARGGGGVNADTVAKAQRAVAQWEKAKAKAHATPNKSDHSNPVYAPGRQVLLARPADQSGPVKKDDKKERKADQSKLPEGATGWKHGWIPVDENGKAVGPAQPPKWLQDAKAKHKAAGGRTYEEIQAEKVKNERDARARKAAAPAKKAKAEAERKAREAESAKKATARKAAMAEREKKRAAARAERDKEQKARARERQIQAAYRQAMTDRKNGRELSEQQRRVVAYVEAQQRKEQGKLRRVDVPGVDGSTVASRARVAKRAVSAPKVAPRRAGGTATARRAGAVTAQSGRKSAGVVRAVSYDREGKRRAVRLTADEMQRVNVLDFAGKFPKGQLAFRYKHGWILINPAIPSRGRLGGGLARKHGHKSGSVTHGRFEPGEGGKGKKFVPERHGGENNPAKLKAAHSKLKGAPADKSKYRLAAAMKDTGGNALKPNPKSPAEVKKLSTEANAASAKANGSKSLHDAQVAAKKHADAFVQAKKAGDDQLAASHKANAQAWAKKAQQIKQAEAASKKAQEKYEAEQKAKAAEEKAKAEKAKLEAEKAAAEKKVHQDENNALKAAANDAYKAAFDMPEDTNYQKTKKAEAFEDAAKKAGVALQHGGKHDLPQDNLTAAKLSQSKEKAEALKKDVAEQKKLQHDFLQKSDKADEMTEKAEKNPTPENHKAAAQAHLLAGIAGSKISTGANLKKFHDKKVSEHLKAAEEAQKAQSETGPGMADQNKLDGLTDSVDATLDELFDDIEVEGGQGLWDDYLHAAAIAKVKPTTANMQKLAKAKQNLKNDGALDYDIQKATASLFKKQGLLSPAKKAAAKKTAAKKTAAKKTTTAPKPEEKTYTAEDFKVTLPGPGMYADGNAVTAAYKAANAETDPAKKAAKLKAAENAAQAFKVKHGKEFDTSKVELMSSPAAPFVPQHGGGNTEHPFFDEAKKAGFEPISPAVSANGNWKPSDVPGLKSNKGAYTYSSNAYTAINNQLRHGVGPSGGQWDATIAQMDKEFDAVPGLDKGLVVMRSMSGKGPFDAAPPYMQPGGVFVDPGYSSTSKVPGTWSGETFMEVRIPAGTKVLDLNHTTGSQHSGENEVLLDRDTHYKIVSDGPGHNGQGRLIVVEIVPGPKKPQKTA